MKRIIVIIIGIAISLSLSGCVLSDVKSLFFPDSSSKDKEITEKEKIIKAEIAIERESQKPKIGFTTSGHENYENAIFVDTEDLLSYSSELSQYSSSYFYDLLTDDERLVYRAMEYAMEHSYSHIVVDERVCATSDDLVKILDYLSMDSPFVEQNLAYTTYSFNYNFPIETEYSTVYIPLSGFSIDVRNFNEDFYEKKLLAKDKATEIIKAIPNNLTESEKALYLFNYVSENVEYFDYGDDIIHTYLYDGLVNQKTQCDGFTNSLSLLYNLSGIQCFEKVSPPGQDEEAGHTWNCAYIDGNWYNYDATSKPDDVYTNYYCGFSDDLIDITPHYQELMPECSKGLYLNYSGHFESESANGVYESFYEGIKANGTYCLLTFDTFDYDKCYPLLERLVNEINRTITSCYTDGTNKTVFLIELTD